MKEIIWRLLAAIAYQESHWDAQATSPTGVRGMMMLTKNTAQSLGITDRTDAEQSISGMCVIYRYASQKIAEKCARPENERIWFAPSPRTTGYAHMLDTAPDGKTKGILTVGLT